MLRARPGQDILVAGRAGPGPHNSICGPGPGRVFATAAGPGRAWASISDPCRTLFRTGRDRSRPVRAQLPVSTRGQLERSFRILETTSRHGTSGRDRSRSVAPCQIYRVDARVGATDLSANQPLLAHAFLIYFFPF